jgi:hypothetical protein
MPARKITWKEVLRQALIWAVLLVGGLVAFNYLVPLVPYLVTYLLSTEKERLAEKYHVSEDHRN